MRVTPQQATAATQWMVMVSTIGGATVVHTLKSRCWHARPDPRRQRTDVPEGGRRNSLHVSPQAPSGHAPMYPVLRVSGSRNGEPLVDGTMLAMAGMALHIQKPGPRRACRQSVQD